MNTDLKKKLDRLQKELELIVAGIGGGGGGDASAANQLLEIAELQTIVADMATQIAQLQSIKTNTTTNIVELQKMTGSNSPTHGLKVNPSALVMASYKKLSFICIGAITVTIDGKAQIYPQSLGGGSTIHGTTFEADDSSLNPVTFNGTGTLFFTIKQ